MAEEPDNHTLRLLREIRDAQRQGFSGVNERLERLEQRMDEVHESTYTALGLAGHANVRHDSVQDELRDIKKRLTKLEEKA